LAGYFIALIGRLPPGCTLAALSLPCAGKYVFRGLQSTRSTYSTEHLEYEAPELQTINPTHGQRAETILVLIQLLTGGGHPYARHPPGYPRGRPGGVISPHTSPVKKTYRPHTVQSAVSPRFYRQGATKQSCATVPARVWLSQPLECIPNPKPNYLMVWRLERVGVLSPQSLGAHRHSCLKLTLPLKNKLTV